MSLFGSENAAGAARRDRRHLAALAKPSPVVAAAENGRSHIYIFDLVLDAPHLSILPSRQIWTAGT
jgi:hypothetical protein